MPHSTAAEAQGDRMGETEQTDLEELLKAKLQAIPPYHLTPLTLSDILEQTPRALHLLNIPPGIQLPFFLCNRAVVNRYGGEPVKVEKLQSLDITRTIFFYRLNEGRQFQRFHDTIRWNTAIFVALLALPADDPAKAPYPALRKHDNKSNGRKMRTPPMNKDTYIPPAARRFMIAYLAAVLEHHNSPALFQKRESFIKTWKSSIWDLFGSFGRAQKKLLKNTMKQLTQEWEEELDHAERSMGRVRYEEEVAKFVGTIIPGRRDQSLPAPLLAQVMPSTTNEGCGDVRVSGDIRLETQYRWVNRKEIGKNELLETLRVPFVASRVDPKGKEQQQTMRHMSETETITVTDLRYAIAAAQKLKPCDMLPVLLKLFPYE
jgi:hypothetical protein